MGSSKACGYNHNKNKKSIHAEELAVNYCRSNDKRNKYDIYIWRYKADETIKSAYCCSRCTKIVTKYNYHGRIYTFNNDTIVSSIIDNPEISLGYKLLHDFK